ncbi:MAG: O-antigen ligase family protein [Bacteroidia bacterium]|nr:O-antigen ligase family protein [Bacteroidia bacterium]
MSVAQFMLAGNWFLEGNFKQKFQLLKQKKAILLFVSILLIHLIWMLFTEDTTSGWRDIRIKIPLVTLPVIIGTSKSINAKQLKILLLFFMAAITYATIACTLVYSGIIHREIKDIRDISIYISHIRFALLINVAIFTCFYYLFGKECKSLIEKLLFPGLILWWLFFLVILESLTGITIFITCCYFYLIFWSFTHKKKMLKIIPAIILIAIPVLIFGYIYNSVSKFYNIEKLDIQHLDKFTSEGNTYEHYMSLGQIENGRYVGLYICESELQSEWSKKSAVEYYGKDNKGQDIRFTLFRYLTSKGLRKDAQGLLKLNSDDIKLVEQGIPNYIYTNKFNPGVMIYKIIWQIDVYLRTENPTGHSVTQRLEYLKAAFGILKSNFWLGTGTGDLQLEFNRKYEEMKTKLDKQFWHRAHNQFITFLLAFGIFGGLWIILAIFYPVFKKKHFKDYLFIPFFIIAVLSMLSDDTLETQAGVTFFAFFYSLFLFGRGDNSL